MSADAPAAQLDTIHRSSRRPGSARALRRLLLGLVAVLAVLLAGGAAYQVMGVSLDARNYPPPGQRIDVGGYRLHLHCVGAGSPTVVLEAAAQGSTANWGWVQPDLARTTRVCAYDRAGMGWSDAVPVAQDAQQVADALATLVARADIAGPIVLVGHSLGGLYTRVYAARHPEQVVGMVLLDAAHPDQYARLPTQRADLAAFERDTVLYEWLARFGLLRLYFALGGEIGCQPLPEHQCAETKSFWSSPAFWASTRAETQFRPTTDNQARAAGTFGALPLMVVTAGDGASLVWLDLQRNLAGLSSRGAQEVVGEATHMGLVFSQSHARTTSAAIQAVVDATRTGPGARP